MSQKGKGCDNLTESEAIMTCDEAYEERGRCRGKALDAMNEENK
jgi:hypothetical protein